GGDFVHLGEPCEPIRGEKPGDYNEVFLGGGVVEECVFYVCGSEPGELGHCVQHNKPNNRQTLCSNSDNNMCTYDYCLDGLCKADEWIPGASSEGVGVPSTCDPATGIWTHARNGDACRGNGNINTGEQCEVGVDGADARCCVDCYLQSACDDQNVCTDERCVNG